MNIISYKSELDKGIVFCCVDNISTYKSGWTKEVIKNISDYTVSNIVSKGFDLLQGLDEDVLLRHASQKQYTHALVFTTGTEFINGDKFFIELESLIKEDFALAGHILDRKEAYYELHHQCYLVNLKYYKKLGMPNIGKQTLGKNHKQWVPWRSAENYHDDYTPKWVSVGDQTKEYYHQCHGWNLLSRAFEKDYKILVFNETIKNNKKHHYPENQIDFLKHSEWLVARYHYCNTQFIHTTSTDASPIDEKNFSQLLVPASGNNYENCALDNADIIFYDYNPTALDYWRQKTKNQYKYVLLDLLGLEFDLTTIIDITNQNTLINLSNIFSYEGTASFNTLEYRIYKENNFINLVKKQMPNATISFSLRAATGFLQLPRYGLAKNFLETNLNQIEAPTWHLNGEWN